MYNVGDQIDRIISRYASILCGSTKVSESNLNGFIWANDRYGIGKLIAVNGRKGRVSFFHSITEAEQRDYFIANLGRAHLSPQTRVYVYDDEAGRWRVGRVLWHFDEGEQIWYEIRFPNGHQAKFPEANLQVRCLQPKVDPTEVLAYGGTETQFFHDRRWRTVETLLKVRAASRGLTGLISSSVELLSHQLEVVRRVLEDPIQRYMLADEVGLGKTIEAGTIIRQCLLDNPEEHIVVLTPPTLVRQWQQELEEKFHINEFPDSVIVLPFEEMYSLKEGKCTLLIVDEAHLLVDKELISRRSYNQLVHLAHSSRRLLLLSATPILGHEETTLALLHLLDPVTYRLDDRERFRTRIERRQEYGQRLLALNPKLPPPILNHALQQVLQAFPNDSIVTQLVDQLKQPGADVGYIINGLKKHIAETYRLHQRLLRTRRRELEGQELLPRRSSLTIEVDDDERIPTVLEGLDNWWYASRRAIDILRAKSILAATEIETRLTRRYTALFEAMGRGVDELALELEHQWLAIDKGEIPSFADEEEIYAQLSAAISVEPKLVNISDYLTSFEGTKTSSPLSVTSRIALAATSLTLMLRGVSTSNASERKIVAFSSSTHFAKQLHECLLAINDHDSVFGIFDLMSPDNVEAVIRQFRNTQKPAVIICDKGGEFGLNFHFAQGIVHLDLPLAPARLEQRIGRVDRFGRQQEVIRQRVIIPSDESHSPWLAWYELLRSAFKIFDQSISEVHFVLDKLEQDIHLVLYREGVTGLKNLTTQISKELDQERQRLDEQYALDRLATDEEEATMLFSTLKKTDENETDLEKTVDQWLKSVLKFSHKYAPYVAHDVFSYRWSEQTLAPQWPWRVFLADGLDQPEKRQYLTYRRAVAKENPEVALMRPGFSLIDRIEQFMTWDDRGSAFATWRVDPEWSVSEHGEWMGFRLCYVVEADMNRIAERLGNYVEPHLIPSIQRRTDSFLPSWTEMLHIDINLQVVEDPKLLAILTQSYSRTTNDASQRDYNLGSRQEALFRLVDIQAFIELCRQVREHSEGIVRNSAHFLERVRLAYQRTHQELKIRNDRLRRRNEAIVSETGKPDPNIKTEIAINEAIIEGVAQPRIQLDSIGFFIIADYPPNEATGDE